MLVPPCSSGFPNASLHATLDAENMEPPPDKESMEGMGAGTLTLHEAAHVPSSTVVKCEHCSGSVLPTRQHIVTYNLRVYRIYNVTFTCPY